MWGKPPSKTKPLRLQVMCYLSFSLIYSITHTCIQFALFSHKSNYPLQQFLFHLQQKQSANDISLFSLLLKIPLSYLMFQGIYSQHNLLLTCLFRWELHYSSFQELSGLLMNQKLIHFQDNTNTIYLV